MSGWARDALPRPRWDPRRRRQDLRRARCRRVPRCRRRHGPDDEPLTWFIEYAVAGQVKGAELAGEGRPELSLGITESGRRGRGAQTAAIGSSEDSTPTGRRHGPSLPPAAQPANRHTIRGMSGRGARKPCRFSSDRLYLKRLHRPPYSWGESPSSQRQDHGLHRGALAGFGWLMRYGPRQGRRDVEATSIQSARPVNC